MRYLSIFLMLWFSANIRSASALEAGVGSCDITPDVKTYEVPMAGYGARQGKPSTGVHDPLHAKVLFLRDGSKVMAVITSDLRSITPEFKNQILEKSPRLGLSVDNLLVCAAHDHDGPSMYPEAFWQMQFGKYDPKVVDIMSTSVAKALKEAAASTAPVAIGWGEARVEGFTRNRRWDDDKAAREAAHETAMTDPILTVLRVDALPKAGGEKKCLVLLVNFATHPTILGADNMLISAEWPGALQAELERQFPGTVAMYTNGAEGDQAPAGSKGADAFEKLADFGKRLAAEAATVARKIETAKDAPIAYARVTPDLPKIVFSDAAMKGPRQAMIKVAPEALPKKAEIQVFKIGDTAMAALPGEALCEVGMDARDRVRKAGAKRAIVVGLSNDYLGYIVNQKEYKHGGYEVDSRSYYGPGLGDFIAGGAESAAKAVYGK